KVLGVKPIKHLTQIHVTAQCSFSTSESGTVRAHDTSAFLNDVREYESPVRLMMGLINLLSVKLSQKNLGKRVVNLRRSIGEDIADANGQPALVKPCCVV